MKLFRLLLFPFSLLYGLITRLRNLAFDTGILKSQSFDISTLVIGNLNTGGTGKTPHTEYFIRKFSHRKTGVISRGYGRRTKGFRLVEINDDPLLSGDEPLQIKRKFPEIPVAVCSDRVMAVPALLSLYPDLDLLIFDDAFQHRYLKAEKYVLLTAYGDLFTHDRLLPSGNLREPASGYKRAHEIIITKCPEQVDEKERLRIFSEISPLPDQKIYFTRFVYGAPRTLTGRQVEKEAVFGKRKLLVFSAIAHGDSWCDPFKEYFTERLPSITFRDHHFFTKKNIGLLLKTVERAGIAETTVLTTEKDAMRLQSFTDDLSGIALFYIPVEVEFI